MQLSDGPWFDSGWPDFSTHAAKDANWNTQVVYLPCKACLVFQIYVSMYGMYVTSISERFLIYCLRFQTNKMRNFGRSEEQFWQDTSYGIAVCNGVCVWHQISSNISESWRKKCTISSFFRRSWRHAMTLKSASESVNSIRYHRRSRTCLEKHTNLSKLCMHEFSEAWFFSIFTLQERHIKSPSSSG